MIDVGVAERALAPGRSGDRAVVLPAEDAVLLAAIDGLGHGDPAAEAADAACEALQADRGAGLVELFARCHSALERTRGAVMTAARLHASGTMEWLGVGNVEARLLRAGGFGAIGESPVLFGGILGAGTVLSRPPRPSTVQLARGDVLVMATDGVRPDFATGLSAAGTPQAIAEDVMRRSGRTGDDALVLVARWLGPDG